MRCCINGTRHVGIADAMPKLRSPDGTSGQKFLLARRYMPSCCWSHHGGRFCRLPLSTRVPCGVCFAVDPALAAIPVESCYSYRPATFRRLRCLAQLRHSAFKSDARSSGTIKSCECFHAGGVSLVGEVEPGLLMESQRSFFDCGQRGMVRI
jgi:hypothetical protein